jgi:hypothetical protein
MKLMPWIGGMILVFVVLFSFYVRSVPSKAVRVARNNDASSNFSGEGFEPEQDPEATLQALKDNATLKFKVLNPEADTVVEEGSTSSEETIIEL